MKALVSLVLEAVLSAVESAGPEGVPGGTLYAALMTQGCTLEQYAVLMDLLTSSGVLVKRGERYSIPPKPPTNGHAPHCASNTIGAPRAPMCRCLEH
jgi:hypothetical protein